MIFFLGFPDFPDFFKPKNGFLRILFLGLPEMEKWIFNFFCLRLPEIETWIQYFETWIFHKNFSDLQRWKVDLRKLDIKIDISNVIFIKKCIPRYIIFF